MAADALYWAPWQGTLEAVSAGAAPSTLKLLDGHVDWLVDTLSSFKPPSENSRQLLKEKTTTVKGRKFVIDQRLVDATKSLSTLLVCWLCNRSM